MKTNVKSAKSAPETSWSETGLQWWIWTNQTSASDSLLLRFQILFICLLMTHRCTYQCLNPLQQKTEVHLKTRISKSGPKSWNSCASEFRLDGGKLAHVLAFSRFNHSNAHIHKAVSPCCVSKDRLENPFTGLKSTSRPSYVSDALAHFRRLSLRSHAENQNQLVDLCGVKRTSWTPHIRLWLYLLYISIFSCSVLYLICFHVFNFWMFELSSLEFGVADLNLIWMLYFILWLICNFTD